MEIQLGLIESILNFLYVSPRYLFGLVVVAIILFVSFRKHPRLPKLRISLASIVLYYYLCIMMLHIVGILTLSEFNRLRGFGEPLINPNLNLIPFNDGFGLGDILNIILFIPLGFLSPIISPFYGKLKNVILLGAGLSLAIEISQLFTLHRATDINDLLVNTLGAVIGYFCFRLIARLFKRSANQEATWFIPIMVTLSAIVFVFLL